MCGTGTAVQRQLRIRACQGPGTLPLLPRWTHDELGVIVSGRLGCTADGRRQPAVIIHNSAAPQAAVSHHQLWLASRATQAARPNREEADRQGSAHRLREMLAAARTRVGKNALPGMLHCPCGHRNVPRQGRNAAHTGRQAARQVIQRDSSLTSQCGRQQPATKGP